MEIGQLTYYKYETVLDSTAKQSDIWAVQSESKNFKKFSYNQAFLGKGTSSLRTVLFVSFLLLSFSSFPFSPFLSPSLSLSFFKKYLFSFLSVSKTLG